MTSRVTLIVITLFWIVMNVLLWRSEYGTTRPGSAPVPPELVFERILTSPDPSTLRVIHRGERIGLLRWIPTVIEGTKPQGASQLEGPEGMVTETLGYRIEVDFTHQALPLAERWRFALHTDLDTNRMVQDLRVRWNRRPMTFEVDASSSLESVVVRVLEGTETRFEQTFKTKELESVPSKLSSWSAWLPVNPLFQDLFDPTRWQESWKWEAFQDRLQIGGHGVRVYRLETRLLDVWDVVAHVSRAGELLRVDVANEVSFVNNDIPGLGNRPPRN